jgi:phosphatidylinositol-3,4,5-trisphosphate 3-phosphatase and dual-specificity protein phosphatase PTEN
MACSYLLSQEFAMSPVPSKTTGSTEARTIATERADELMDIMPPDEETQKAVADDKLLEQAPESPKRVFESTALSDKGEPTSPTMVASPRSLSVSSAAATPAGARTPVEGAQPPPLQNILDLHTSKRMKTQEEKEAKAKEKQKKGVSIPSQRRWLLYWSLLLAGAGPRGFWDLRPDAVPQNLKAKIVSIRVRLREPRGAMPILARAVNTIMDQGGLGNPNAPKNRRGEVWVSLARYNDKLVNTLEAWEKHTRSEDANLGVRKAGSDHMDSVALVDMFKTDKWDKEKVSCRPHY